MTAGRGPRGARRAAGGHTRHIPVLLAETLDCLRPKPGASYIDGTFGAGGTTRAILEAADCRVLAIDRDEGAVAAGADLVRSFAPRLTLVRARFSELANLAIVQALGPIDGIVLDLGVSSLQLGDEARGFSFQNDGPLDMRMSRASSSGTDSGMTAADLVNGCSEATLADLLFHFGEERRARAVAHAIVATRRRQPITRTGQLAGIVASVFGAARTAAGRHAATRTFLALRIAVNDELSEAAQGLAAAEALLQPGGRLVVITFHSLEDRIVKRFFTIRAGREPGGSRHRPRTPSQGAPTFRFLNHRPVIPRREEIASNPRARSAKLRTGVRTDAPAQPLDLRSLTVPMVDLAGVRNR